jgi:hypothetical protein
MAGMRDASYRRLSKKTLLIALLSAALLGGLSASSGGVAGGRSFSSPAGPPPYPLEAKVASLLGQKTWVGDWHPTGINEDFYAAVSEPIVRQAVAWQNAKGRIIDPFVGYETPTATARFVGALAGLMLKGRCLDLADNGIRALTAAAGDLYKAAEKPVAGSEFYAKELMLGYLALRDRVDAATLALWKKCLGGFDPEANYEYVLAKHPAAELHNYTTFALAGEQFKKRYEIADNTEFIERHLATQLPRFTAFGMYRDPNNPMLYDVTGRMNLSLLVFFGYDGPRRAALEEMLRRGALTQLLYMSPTGEFPYGGRSNQQNFNEATAALVLEYEAARLKKAGDPELAGVFKRAARLAALSIRRWLDLRPVRFIKNEFPPSTQHGRQKDYGFYAVYSLLIASQFGFANLVADPGIAERPVPWERGGYVIRLDDDFHKIFAACRGYGLEIDTRADHHYDATGLGRIHKTGVPTETALSTPIVAKPEYLVSTPEAPRGIAIGPGWKSGGRSVWPSHLSGEIEKVGLESGAETADRVRFKVVYDCGKLLGAVTETYDLDGRGLTVDWELARPAAGSPEALQLQVPLLETNGRFKSEIKPAKRGFVVDYQGHAYNVECVSPREVETSLEGFAAPNRNGIYRVGLFSVRGSAASCRFSLD